MGSTRVLVVGGSEIVLAGLRRVLGQAAAIQVVASADRGDRGLELIGTVRPDVIVVDDALADQDAPSFCSAALARNSRVAIVLVVTHGGRDVLSRTFRSGARGFLHVTASASDLLRAVVAVARGGTVLDPVLATRLVEGFHDGSLTKLHVLSQREMQVMELVEAGESNLRIARQLGVSPNTVKTYIRRSLDKLACQTRAEGAAQLARRGRRVI